LKVDESKQLESNSNIIN